MISKIRYVIGIFIFLLAVFFAYFIFRPIDADVEAGKHLRTDSVLLVCGYAIDAWVKKEGRVPTDHEGLSVLGMKTSAAVDAWGRQIVYRPNQVNSLPQFLLYSLGPNGIDENGSGDDIAYKK